MYSVIMYIHYRKSAWRETRERELKVILILNSQKVSWDHTAMINKNFEGFLKFRNAGNIADNLEDKKVGIYKYC